MAHSVWEDAAGDSLGEGLPFRPQTELQAVSLMTAALQMVTRSATDKGSNKVKDALLAQLLL